MTTDTDALHQEALALHHTGRYEEAEAAYQQCLRHHPENADAWRNLGMVYYQQQRYGEAKQALQRALAVDDRKAIQHYCFGLVLEQLGEVTAAMQAYQQALAIEPALIDAYSGLGHLLEATGQLTEAAAVYQQAIAIDATYVGGHMNLGNVLLALGQASDAIHAYKQALTLQPTNADIFYNLGIAFDQLQQPLSAAFCYGYAAFHQRDYTSAVHYFEQVIAAEVLEINCYLAMIEAYRHLNQPEDADRIARLGLHHYPTSHELYIEWLRTMHHFHREQDALEVAHAASQRLPHELIFQLYQRLFLPIMYDTLEDIVSWRQRFSEGMATLAQEPNASFANRDSVLRAIRYHNNFYLQYQGYNDRDLQQQYGQFVQRVMATYYPDWSRPRPHPGLTLGEKIRVAYISEGFSHNVTGKLLSSLYRYTDRQQFAIYTYLTSEKSDYVTGQYRLYSDVFRQLPESVEQVCAQIASDAPHIVVFPAIGMRPFITELACLRLAPVQCTTWLHPTTSGIPTIDYFLGSDAMEPDNAQDHYSETLVRLPNLGIPYPTPVLPPLTCQRPDLGLPNDALLYISCQALPKYLPQYDYLYAEIAHQMPQAKLVFVRHVSTSVTDLFCRRLQRAFAQLGLDYSNHCIILPRLHRNYYFALLQLADIFLDTIGWSGGVTSAEAIACGLPIVTCPGELMRGRQSYGMLNLIGVTDTIAHNPQEYVALAVRLGQDQTWRADVKRRLLEQGARLYDDRSCVTALESFYRQVIIAR